MFSPLILQKNIIFDSRIASLYKVYKFWIVRSFASKEYAKQMKIADSVVLCLFMTSPQICNTGHAPYALA